jgi:hypothetical protein
MQIKDKDGNKRSTIQYMLSPFVHTDKDNHSMLKTQCTHCSGTGLLESNPCSNTSNSIPLERDSGNDQ